MTDPTGFKKAFCGFGVIGIVGSIAFYLAQQHVYWNKDEIMAARERIVKAAAKGNQEKFLRYSQEYADSPNQKKLKAIYGDKDSN